MATAERLFAEYGVSAVSSRQISEAAGQGNNAAVGYHFGTKDELIRAIVYRHDEQIELDRRRRVERIAGAGTVREWVECLVLPYTEHLAAANGTSWYARFIVQVCTDPALRGIIAEKVSGSTQFTRIAQGLLPRLAQLPTQVCAERVQMIHTLHLNVCAERERALAASGETPGPAWEQTAALLVDAITGLLLAPVSVA
jgi:AcrR family transcriptional regulator